MAMTKKKRTYEKPRIEVTVMNTETLRASCCGSAMFNPMGSTCEDLCHSSVSSAGV